MFAENAKQFRWTAFLIFILGFGVLFAGCGSDESDGIPSGPAETVESLVIDGWMAFNNGETDAALDLFSRAANAEATNTEAYLGLGYSFSEKNELERAHQNFGNVIALSTVLIESGVITQAEADTLLAETYAGKATAYLAGGFFDDAVSSGDLAIAIWTAQSNPGHRWIDGFDLTDLKLIVVDAHYNANRYNQAMLIVDELDNNSFITNAVHIFSDTEILNPDLLETTWQTGIAQLVLVDNSYLIHPISVLDADGGSCTIESFDMAGDMIEFKANPIPTATDLYTVSYYYSDDFGEFLIELRDKIIQLEG
jgi:tetratricopeptide (TPR) repeat protein